MLESQVHVAWSSVVQAIPIAEDNPQQTEDTDSERQAKGYASGEKSTESVQISHVTEFSESNKVIITLPEFNFMLNTIAVLLDYSVVAAMATSLIRPELETANNLLIWFDLFYMCNLNEARSHFYIKVHEEKKALIKDSSSVNRQSWSALKTSISCVSRNYVAESWNYVKLLHLKGLDQNCSKV